MAIRHVQAPIYKGIPCFCPDMDGLSPDLAAQAGKPWDSEDDDPEE
jgi:hypothetical protein